ncbi:M56 family metallopeptidase [Streptomyces sp. NBC_01511]|uniref:M56 family metallopeptidase n=1 Tax=Streptomyces sp. NBC_01511 TaxID=2903889 RepID=UPI00386A51CC
MTTAAVLAVYTLLIGTAAPHLLVRASWLHRAPTAAITAWLALAATFVVSGALACYHLLLSEPHVHDGLVGLLTACGLMTGGPARDTPPTPGDLAAVLLPAALVLLPALCLVRISWRTHRARRRQRDMLTLVGSPAPRYGATVVDHAVPAVYCLPGRAPRIVITSAALRALSDGQLRAVLAHEHAHIAGHHHLVHAAAEAFARAFPGLPLARLAKEQTALLLEMAADDRALRGHPREVLAAAMYEVAAGQTPRLAMGAGGSGSLIRIRRVLDPPPKPRRATAPAVVLASAAAPLLPLLIACGPLA